MRTSTKLYKCTDRGACLRNTTAIPMTVYCDENHTNVMCSRCYHRRVDCDRAVKAGGRTCAPPAYFDRGEKWMYFAKIARHCERCPAGSAAHFSYVLTAFVALAMVVVIAVLVAAQLRNVGTRIREMASNVEQHNSTGPIARMLLNFLQATALLTAIKFTPPDAVQEVSVYAEYAQGVSTNSFFIRCTLRWNYYKTFAFELLNPILQCLIPALLVIVWTPMKGRLTYAVAAAKLRYDTWAAMSATETSALQFARLRAATRRTRQRVARRERQRERLRREGIWDDASLELGIFEGPAARPLANEPSAVGDATAPDAPSVADTAAASRITLDVDHETATNTSDTAAPVPLDDESMVEDSARAVRRERIFDVRVGFFVNVTGAPLQLRAAPDAAAQVLPLAIHPMQPVRAEERVVASDGSGAYIRVASRSMGSGWLPLESEGAVLLRNVAAAQVVLTREYDAESIAPAGAIVEHRALDGNADASTHRYRALAALCPEAGITRDVIDLVFPAGANEFDIDRFMRRYDLDGDGALSEQEYANADDVLHATWRFRSV